MELPYSVVGLIRAAQLGAVRRLRGVELDLPLALMDIDLRLRVTVLRPPPDVVFQIQRGRNELLPPTRLSGREISFDVDLRVRGTLPDGRPDISGPLGQGPPRGRFLYLNSGTRAGQKDSCWDRRAKIPLAGISWPLVREVNATQGARLEALIEGTAPDGGPACATVQLIEGGWRVLNRSRLTTRWSRPGPRAKMATRAPFESAVECERVSRVRPGGSARGR